MASPAKFFSLFFLVAVSSVQIHARESEFFSKFGNAEQQSRLPTKEDHLNKPEDEPDFVRETSQNGYGLFGNEPGQLPPTTYASSETSQKPKSGEALYRYRDTPTTTTATSGAGNYYNSVNRFETQKQGGAETRLTGGASDNYYNSIDGYETPKQGVGESRLTGGTTENYYNNVDGYETQKQGVGEERLTGGDGNYYNGVNGYKTQKQRVGEARLTGADGNNYNGINGYETQKHGVGEERLTGGDGNYYNGVNGYETQKQSVGEERLTGRNGNNYNGINGYETQKKGPGETRLTGRQNSYWNNAVNGYNQQQQRQGMSDTRYIANGRFYYDVNADRSGNRNYGIKNVYGNSKSADSRTGNGYDSYNQGFAGTKSNGFYTPNGREGVQTQMQIQEDDDEFVP